MDKTIRKVIKTFEETAVNENVAENPKTSTAYSRVQTSRSCKAPSIHPIQWVMK